MFAIQAAVTPKQMLRLEVATEDDKFKDLGHLWLDKRLRDTMVVETVLLEALDASILILMSYIPRLQEAEQADLISSVRKLCGWLLAVRHNYLNSVVYSVVEKLYSKVMAEVNILVVSGSNLNKIRAGQSNWSEWFAKHQSLGLLCVDEVPGQSIESVGNMAFFWLK